jgi:hypothetical protein
MDVSAGTIAHPRELLLVSVAGAALSVLMTWPLTPGLGHLGRTGGADGQYSIWNVAWAARTLMVDGRHLFNANIFYPHHTTLAYSEANLAEGALAIPVYWSTRNPYAAHNIVVLFSMASAFVCAYLLMRYITDDDRASAVAAILYACCPYVTTHSAHIQLLMTGGLPLAMLLLHRLADAPSIRRGVWLAAAIVAQTLACAYYGIFAALMLGFATLTLAALRRLWTSRGYWVAVATAALTSIAGLVPIYLQYLSVQHETGFRRTLKDAAPWAANPQSYLASPAHAHRWLLGIAAHFGRFSEPLFPGMLALGFGVAGLAIAVRRGASGDRKSREVTVLYGSIGLLALSRAPLTPASYAVLATLPVGPVAEFPFYGERMMFPLHARYMLFATAHWMPLVNGYSDVIPGDFRHAAPLLGSFPSRDSFVALARYRVRYITIHWDMYGPQQEEIRTRLEPFVRDLRVLARDPQMTLYEVISIR